jgi:hypothetical protein
VTLGAIDLKKVLSVLCMGLSPDRNQRERKIISSGMRKPVPVRLYIGKGKKTMPGNW